MHKATDALFKKWAEKIGFPLDSLQVKSVDRRLALRYMYSSSIVLDVGGGKGIDAGPFANLAASVVLVEIDRMVLREGAAIARDAGLQKKIDLVRASATALPFREQKFDIVACFSVLDHLPTKRNVVIAIEEFARVVRPDGHVVITFPNKTFLPGTISMFARRVFNSDLYWEQRFTPREFHRFLLTAGLVPATYDYGTVAFVGSGIRQYNLPAFIRSWPPALSETIFFVMFEVVNRILSWNGMYIFGPRFGILSYPTNPTDNGRNLTLRPSPKEEEHIVCAGNQGFIAGNRF